jgi:hypothetical protein
MSTPSLELEIFSLFVCYFVIEFGQSLEFEGNHTTHIVQVSVASDATIIFPIDIMETDVSLDTKAEMLDFVTQTWHQADMVVLDFFLAAEMVAWLVINVIGVVLGATRKHKPHAQHPLVISIVVVIKM